MERHWFALLGRLSLFIGLLTACAAATPTETAPMETSEAPFATHAPVVPQAALSEAVGKLAAALEGSGLSVEAAPGESAGLFDAVPTALIANGAIVEVYEFADETAAQTAAATIPDLLARSRWAAPPHFYADGALIVLYVGEDADLTTALEAALGAEIGGSDGGEDTIETVTIFLIAVGDNGASGDLIGCGDSIVPVERPVAPTGDPLVSALTELVTLQDQTYGESGLYNALYLATLAVEAAVVEEGLATVHLIGQFVVGGECDSPRFKAQIEYTVRQFPGVERVQVFVNDLLLDDLLNAQG